jgi:hypothetical protein
MLLHPAFLVDEIKKAGISWYSLSSSVKLVRATNLTGRQVPNADAIFATSRHTSPLVSACPRDKGAKFYLVQDFPPWLGDQNEIEQTWRLPLKKIVVYDAKTLNLCRSVSFQRLLQVRDFITRPSPFKSCFFAHNGGLLCKLHNIG